MASEHPIDSDLEHDRLEHRAVRIRRVLDALRERTEGSNGATPRPLRAAIEDFGRELAQLERRLGHARRGSSLPSPQS